MRTCTATLLFAALVFCEVFFSGGAEAAELGCPTVASAPDGAIRALSGPGGKIPEVVITARPPPNPEPPPPPLPLSPAISFQPDSSSHLSDGTFAGYSTAVTGQSAKQAKAQDNTKGQTSCKPVMIATGEKLLTESDFESGGLYGLSHSRHYRSRWPAGSVLGTHWNSSLNHPRLEFSGCYGEAPPPCPPTGRPIPERGNAKDKRARQSLNSGSCAPTSVTITDPAGERDIYAMSRGIGNGYRYAGSSLAAGTLDNVVSLGTVDSWTLLKEQDRYQYTASGHLLTLDMALNHRLQFTHDYGSGQRQLTRVTNRAGAAVEFTWTRARIRAVRDPAGGVWQYAYSPNGNLQQVAAPRSPSNVRSYHYDAPVATHLLTGVFINSTRHTVYGDDSDGRVNESGLAVGESRDTFS